LNKLKIMKQLFTYITLFVFGIFISQAQVLLQDFSNLSNNSTADVYGSFGGGQTTANTAVADPVDANNTVRQVTVTAGGDVWKGIFMRPQTHYMDLTANQTVSLKVYSTTAIHLRGIIQGGQSGQATIDDAANTVAHSGSGWETLSFTFTGATGEWSELAIRTSVDAAGELNNTAAYTAYVDDLTAVQGTAIPVPAVPSDSPAAPTKDAADVISIYSDAYTDIATEYNPAWNQSGSVSTGFDPGDGNNLMVYSNFNYQGTLLTATDMAAMEFLHVDIWVASDDTNTYQVTPIGSGETLVDITTTPGSWSSVDIPVTSFTAVNFSSVDQMKFAGGNGKSIYLDNIYFWKEPTAAGTDATLSDLQIDNVTIAGLGASTSYSVALVEGTTTVPQITSVTTTDTNANAVITQATAIPGDATVVVTAADGTTTETYTVSFFIGKPAAAPTAPTRDAASVISIYSDAYTSVATNMNPGWGQAGTVDTAYDAGDGNNLLVYSNFNYQGTEIASSDISNMNYLHIDIWVAANDTRTVKVSPIGGGETLVTVATTPGTWNSVDIPVSSFTGVSTPEAVAQLKFDGQFAADGVTADTAVRSNIYLDNIYFFSGTLSIDNFDSSFSVYPNPVQNTLNVSAAVTIDAVSIFDLTGREVMRATPNATAFTLDVADLNKGMYLVSLKAGDQEMTTKLVK
jgi:hypothetical protein